MAPYSGDFAGPIRDRFLHEPEQETWHEIIQNNILEQTVFEPEYEPEEETWNEIIQNNILEQTVFEPEYEPAWCPVHFIMHFISQWNNEPIRYIRRSAPILIDPPDISYYNVIRTPEGSEAGLLRQACAFALTKAESTKNFDDIVAQFGSTECNSIKTGFNENTNSPVNLIFQILVVFVIFIIFLTWDNG